LEAAALLLPEYSNSRCCTQKQGQEQTASYQADNIASCQAVQQLCSCHELWMIGQRSSTWNICWKEANSTTRTGVNLWHDTIKQRRIQT